MKTIFSTLFLCFSTVFVISSCSHDEITNEESPNNTDSYRSCPDDKHPHKIDLGLSSGTKWACCNVGATTPEGYGDYYAWSETETKDNYNFESYSAGTDFYIRYDIAGTRHDVAHAKWGETWRMPSVNHVVELCSECTWKWTVRNGVSGRLVTGRNGGTVFLPASGGRYDKRLEDKDIYGDYWTSEPYANEGQHSCTLSFNSEYWNTDHDYHGYGHTIRAVCP